MNIFRLRKLTDESIVEESTEYLIVPRASLKEHSFL